MRLILTMLIGLAIVILTFSGVIAQDRPRTPTREVAMEIAWPKSVDRGATLVGPVQVAGSELVYTFRERSGAIKVLVVEIKGSEVGEYALFVIKP